jgi:hypothetical protein
VKKEKETNYAFKVEWEGRKKKKKKIDVGKNPKCVTHTVLLDIYYAELGKNQHQILTAIVRCIFLISKHI